MISIYWPKKVACRPQNFVVNTTVGWWVCPRVCLFDLLPSPFSDASPVFSLLPLEHPNNDGLRECDRTDNDYTVGIE